MGNSDFNVWDASRLFFPPTFKGSKHGSSYRESTVAAQLDGQVALFQFLFPHVSDAERISASKLREGASLRDTFL